MMFLLVSVCFVCIISKISFFRPSKQQEIWTNLNIMYKRKTCFGLSSISRYYFAVSPQVEALHPHEAFNVLFGVYGTPRAAVGQCFKKLLISALLL